MIILYSLCAAFGLPLVLWFALVGDSDGDFGGDIGGDVGDFGDIGGGPAHSHGGPIDNARSRIPIPIGSIPFAAAGFGITGLAIDWLSNPASALVAAVVVGLVAGFIYAALLRTVGRTGSSSEIGDRELEGRRGRVVLAIPSDGRGQVLVNAGGQDLYFTARAHDPAEEQLLVEGSPVVVVAIEDGVARVAHADLDALDP